MAKFPRKNLPAPPTEAEIPDNLQAPETAPAPEPSTYVDGRSARATGRTEQLATRVTPAFHKELRVYAATHEMKLVEVLEKAFEALKAQELER